MKEEGSRAPAGAGAERRTRDPPRGRAHLRIAGDDRPDTPAGAPHGAPLRHFSAPVRASPGDQAGLERAPRAGVVVPPGRVPKPPGWRADEAHRAGAAPADDSALRTAWLISARDPARSAKPASPVDAPQRARW